MEGGLAHNVPDVMDAGKFSNIVNFVPQERIIVNQKSIVYEKTI